VGRRQRAEGHLGRAAVHVAGRLGAGRHHVTVGAEQRLADRVVDHVRTVCADRALGRGERAGGRHGRRGALRVAVAAGAAARREGLGRLLHAAAGREAEGEEQGRRQGRSTKSNQGESLRKLCT
jgi:hypothetical protein